MNKKLSCLRCDGLMQYIKDEKLQLGQTGWALGDLPNLLAGAMDVAIYACQSCGKKGDINVNILGIGIPLENKAKYNEIAEKLKKAYEQNPSWYIEHRFDTYIEALIDGNCGVIFPYTEKFGVTREEYENLFKLTDLCKKSDGTINIKKVSDNKFSIKAVKGINLINSIDIDLSNNTILTKYGVCKYEGQKLASPNDKTISSKFISYKWGLESNLNVSKSLKNLSFHIGQLNSTNETIIYFKCNVISEEDLVSGVEIVSLRKD